MQDFDDFIARLLSRPGIETAILRSGEHTRDKVTEDIITADGVGAIKGPDGVPFLSGGRHDELRLLWCLSVDFFNPYHNKIAGKVASVGSIILSCPLLLLDIRHKPENLYLLGIIPGPREPSGEEIDHFLRPLVEVMKESWAHGKKYKMHDYPYSQLVCSAIALSVNDLPMAQKIMGFTNYVNRKVTREENLELLRPCTLQSCYVPSRGRYRDSDLVVFWCSSNQWRERSSTYTAVWCSGVQVISGGSGALPTPSMIL
jgi:hypothetical protein